MTVRMDTSPEALRLRREDLHRENRRRALVAHGLTAIALLGLITWWQA